MDSCQRQPQAYRNQTGMNARPVRPFAGSINRLGAGSTCQTNPNTANLPPDLPLSSDMAGSSEPISRAQHAEGLARQQAVMNAFLADYDAKNEKNLREALSRVKDQAGEIGALKARVKHLESQLTELSLQLRAANAHSDHAAEDAASPSELNKMLATQLPARKVHVVLRWHQKPMDENAFMKKIRAVGAQHTFEDDKNNEYVFKKLLPQLVGGKPRAILFAYGQSGSGKTWSLLSELHSIIPSLVRWLLKEAKIDGLEVFISCGQEVVKVLYDVLDDKDLPAAPPKLRSQKRYLGAVISRRKSLSTLKIASDEELRAILNKIEQRRLVLETDANEKSSRGQLVVNLFLGDPTHPRKEMLIGDLTGNEEKHQPKEGDPKDGWSNPEHQFNAIQMAINDIQRLLTIINDGSSKEREAFKKRFNNSDFIQGLVMPTLFRDGDLSNVSTTLLVCLNPNGRTEATRAFMDKNLDFARKVNEAVPSGRKKKEGAETQDSESMIDTQKTAPPRG